MQVSVGEGVEGGGGGREEGMGQCRYNRHEQIYSNNTHHIKADLSFCSSIQLQNHKVYV